MDCDGFASGCCCLQVYSLQQDTFFALKDIYLYSGIVDTLRNKHFVPYSEVSLTQELQVRHGIVSYPDPPPKRKGGSGEYSTASHHWLAVVMDSAKSLEVACWASIGVMSKAKWFVVRKPSTGEIIATSANQIMLYYIPFPVGGLKWGGLGSRLGMVRLIEP